MSRRAGVLGAAMMIVVLPACVALAEAVSFHQRNSSHGSIVSGGIERRYILHVPRNHDARKAVPLVISMHGAGLWPAAQQRLSEWDRVADQEGFLVAYPSGADGRGPRVWAVDGSPHLDQDVRFIGDMIDTISARYAVDADRIYADGLSNGGGMAFVLSCTLRDRIAAVGLVSSAQTLAFEWCPDTRPMPVIVFHGTADPVTPYHGGASWISERPFPDITAWVMSWSRRNACDVTRPMEEAIARDVKRTTYPGCAADVAFYSIDGGGHTWPGGGSIPEWLVGPATRSVDASRELWNFYSAHARSARIGLTAAARRAGTSAATDPADTSRKAATGITAPSKGVTPKS